MSVFVEISIKNLGMKRKTEQREWDGMWKPSRIQMKFQVDLKGLGGVLQEQKPRKGQWNGVRKDGREWAWFVWEMLRVWVREVKGCHLHAGAKTWEALNSQRFELYSVGGGEGKVFRQRSDKDFFFFFMFNNHWQKRRRWMGGRAKSGRAASKGAAEMVGVRVMKTW